MNKEEIEIFYPKSITAWRIWLEKNHLSKQAVWLVFHNKSSQKKSLTWTEAVDIALCFGWIDSKRIKIDEETSHQFFSKRKAKSTWSKINKQKVEKLIAAGQMREEGYRTIETAKLNGSWTIFDDAEELIIPKDLKAEFRKRPVGKAYYESLSRSVKKGILQWIVLAKRPETRQKRITEIVERAEQKLKPKHMQ
ncbi:MAG TPA: YdeI/OmpD-associated family protein [Chitinophagaceae bacterium]|nr:YdeI/OmpD-associated family protein [Chitinophagaceae bacterium]